jgi:hypothetical protein
MTELVEVDTRRRPPMNTPRVLVRIFASGVANESAVAGPNSAIFKAANNPVDIANAIGLARDWADLHDLDSIHIVP